MDAGDEAGDQDGVARLQEGVPYEEDVEDDTDDVDVSSRYKFAVFIIYHLCNPGFLFLALYDVLYGEGSCPEREVILKRIKHAIAKPVS